MDVTVYLREIDDEIAKLQAVRTALAGLNGDGGTTTIPPPLHAPRHAGAGTGPACRPPGHRDRPRPQAPPHERSGTGRHQQADEGQVGRAP